MARFLTHDASSAGWTLLLSRPLGERIGNAARAHDLARARRAVERGLVSARGEAGAAELCREIRGSTLLEAAAVPGPSSALDALDDAMGPAVRARFEPGRVVVAMSGGVDSAVALLEARAAGFAAVGVTLRLWTIPAGPHESGRAARPRPSSPRATRVTRWEAPQSPWISESPFDRRS